MSSKPLAERQFVISYFSEVSAAITIEVYDSSPQVTASATHPVENVPIQDWYHFCDEAEADVSAGAEEIGHVLVKVAAQLYPGCKRLLDEEYGYEEPLFEKFARDVFLAFVSGVWMPADGGPHDGWQHDVGEKLIARTKRDRAIDRKI